MRIVPPAPEVIADHLAHVLGMVREWRMVSSLLGEESHALSQSPHTGWAAGHGHAHPYREVLVPLLGETHFGWRGRVFPCRPGTLFLCEGNETHDLEYPDTAKPLLHMWLTLSPGDCLGSVIWIHQRMLPLWRVHVATSESHLVPCVNRVWDWAQISDSPMIARERLVSALYLLLAEIADRARHPEHAAADTREECVRIAKRMLDRAHGCGLDLAALSRATGYSKYHFHRLFRDQTGQTVHQYADERRRQRADELLAAGLPHKEIAFELGFSSPSAFSRWLHQTGDRAD